MLSRTSVCSGLRQDVNTSEHCKVVHLEYNPHFFVKIWGAEWLTHLEPLGHVCRADLVVLIGHVTALQLTGLVNFKNALPPLPPLCLLLWSVPALFILIFLLLLALVVSIRLKVSKVEVPAKNFLGFLQCSAQTIKVEKLTNTILHKQGD